MPHTKPLKDKLMKNVGIYLCIISLFSTALLIRKVKADSLPGEALTPASPASSCPALPAPTGNIVDVDSVQELQNAVNSAAPSDTIRIADGTYNLNGVYLWIDVPGVTLRSASGNRTAVILNGNYNSTEIITVAASNVTLADLTLREARTHPIHVVTSDGSDTLNTLIYNVHIIDPGQQAIKINPSGGGGFTDNGTIACSHIELTDAGRPWIWTINSSCYTGGVDAHQSRDWVVRDNYIEGFWCGSGLSEHAVHFWRGSRGTVVERNELVDNARGIGFGLMTSGAARTYPDDPCPSAEGAYVGHYEGIVRNNFIYASRTALFDSGAGFDCGICLWAACGAQAVHNTVASTQDPFSSIEWRFDVTAVEIINNLTTGLLRDRGGTITTLAGNLADQNPDLFFMNMGNGDLHLRPDASLAIDQGAALPADLCTDDFDNDPRPVNGVPDVGADEVFDFNFDHFYYLPVTVNRVENLETRN